jgi:hypothetical protein
VIAHCHASFSGQGRHAGYRIVGQITHPSGNSAIVAHHSSGMNYPPGTGLGTIRQVNVQALCLDRDWHDEGVEEVFAVFGGSG